MSLSKNLIGKRIISIDNGNQIGLVRDIYLNRDLQSITGIFCGYEGLFPLKSRVIKRSDITVFGNVAVLATREDVALDDDEVKEFKYWLRRDRLQGRVVVSSKGAKAGVIGDVLIDNNGRVKGFALVEIEKRDGTSIISGFIPREAVLSVGDSATPMKVDMTKVPRQDKKDAKA